MLPMPCMGMMGAAGYGPDLASTIAAFFAAGEQGAWYDPSDFTTMFQDGAGTTPVTATGQLVGLIRDKSGRGNHAFQGTPASQPILQIDGNGKYFLLFDGVDDILSTASIGFVADKMTLWAGVRKLSDGAAGIIAELSVNSTSNNGAFWLIGPNAPAGNNYGYLSRGTALSLALSGAVSPAPNTSVLCGQGDIAADVSIIRTNGASASAAGDQGTGAYGSYPLFIGARSGLALPFSGRIYSLIIRGAASNAGQVASGEAYVNSKTGAY